MIIMANALLLLIFAGTAEFSMMTLQMAAYTGVPIFALGFPRHLFAKNYIGEKTFDFFNSILVHYIASCILLMPYAALLRVFTEVSRNIYLETIVLFTIGYIIVHIGATVVTFVQIQTANKNLQKIHDSQGKD
jgi:hypothetical protein